MATSASSAGLRTAAPARSVRDWITPGLAVGALAALAALPWGSGTPSALAWLFEQGPGRLAAFDAKLALAPVLAAAVAAAWFAWRGQHRLTAAASALALAWAFGTALAAATSGPAWSIGPAVALSLLGVCFARALAHAGAFRSDPTIATIVVVSVGLLVIFVFYPVGKALIAAVQDTPGHFAPGLAAGRLFTEDIWGVGCIGGGTRCGVAINSAILATIVGVLATLLGLVFALVVQRGGRRYGSLLAVMSTLPVITPPFVLALALVVLFGRTG
ncbi:MAG TPA: hypothetical protein VMN79_02675, partial [Casimicrobiaceae bacterium]|nr:hypothetical protein [Casimicrobiaceae bacterium]